MLEKEAKRLVGMVQYLRREVAKMAADFDAAVARLNDRLEALTTVGDAIEVLIRDLVAQVRELAKGGATTAQLNKWADVVESNVGDLRASVLEGTPAEEEPTDGPPEEPPQQPESAARKR